MDLRTKWAIIRYCFDDEYRKEQNEKSGGCGGCLLAPIAIGFGIFVLVMFVKLYIFILEFLYLDYILESISSHGSPNVISCIAGVIILILPIVIMRIGFKLLDLIIDYLCKFVSNIFKNKKNKE